MSENFGNKDYTDNLKLFLPKDYQKYAAHLTDLIRRECGTPFRVEFDFIKSRSILFEWIHFQKEVNL